MALAGKKLQPWPVNLQPNINQWVFASLLTALLCIQNSQSMESPVTINDLVNADGSAAGTEVVIKMPVIYD